MMFFNNLPDFSAKKVFFLPYHICKQFIMSFQILHTVFFSIFLTSPSRKIMVEVGKEKQKRISQDCNLETRDILAKCYKIL